MDGHTSFADLGDLRLDLSRFIHGPEIDPDHAETDTLGETDDPEVVVCSGKPDALAVVFARCLDRAQHERRTDPMALQRAVERQEFQPVLVDAVREQTHDLAIRAFDVTLLLVRIEGPAAAHDELAPPVAFDELGDLFTVGISDLGP